MHNIALQLYTVRDSLKSDFVGTLKQVAAIGYQGIELADWRGGHSAAEFKKIADDLGLKVISGHIDLKKVENPATLETELVDMALLGARYLGLAWIATDLRNRNGYLSVAEKLQTAAAEAAKHHITFFHHNHDFEFTALPDGQLGEDLILGHADGRLLAAELDTFWIQKAGLDPVTMINKYGKRARLIHIKDMTRDDARTFEIVGEGQMDFDAIFKAGDAQNVDWYIVEQDVCPKGEIASARASFNNLGSRGWR